ncbi:MAG TPA: phosphate signaling complex protein PhoU [Anaerolineae bacterium]|nr:phosphate signaling complex protein PhoU [Anaerolineae bacterium]
MPRELLDKQLLGLHDRLLALGSEVQENLGVAAKSLTQRDMVAAHNIIVGDDWINEKWITIMHDCLRLIATQQPMASDMRFVTMVMQIAGELERINDYAKGIARITELLGKETAVPPTPQLPQMAELAQAMLRDALLAFSRRDDVAARQVPKRDDAVDALFNQVYRELLVWASEDPERWQVANYLEWAAHNLERAADRVSNICEWVVYTVTGKYKELS